MSEPLQGQVSAPGPISATVGTLEVQQQKLYNLISNVREVQSRLFGGVAGSDGTEATAASTPPLVAQLTNARDDLVVAVDSTIKAVTELLLQLG